MARNRRTRPVVSPQIAAPVRVPRPNPAAARQHPVAHRVPSAYGCLAGSFTWVIAFIALAVSLATYRLRRS
jgi:hypothetical protein